jgi:hypothetical protein
MIDPIPPESEATTSVPAELELATVDELIDELCKRFHAVIVCGVRPDYPEKDKRQVQLLRGCVGCLIYMHAGIGQELVGIITHGPDSSTAHGQAGSE